MTPIAWHCLVFWAFWLLLATLGGAGAGYLAFYWVAGGALGLLAAILHPRARLAGAILGLIPGAIVTIETATMLSVNIASMSGMVPASMPADMVVIVLVGLATALVGVVAFTLPCRTGGVGKMAIICAVLGAVGIALTAAHSPYSATRPKRLLAVHAADGEQGALLLASTGADGMGPLLSLFPNAKPAPATWPTVMMNPITHMLPAALPAMLAPQAEVTAEHYDPTADTRQVTLHLYGTSAELRLSIPAKTLFGWSASPRLVTLPPTESHYHVNFEGVPSAGVDIQLTLRGSQPVEVDLLGIDGAPASGPEIASVSKRLPDWVTLSSYSYRMARLTL